MIHLQLVTLTGETLNTEVYEVLVPTESGEIAIFPDHEPMVTLAKAGAIAVRKEKSDTDDRLEYYAISGGIVEIGDNVVRVLVDEADHGADIIEAESRAALDRALKLRDEAKTTVELDQARALVDRHTVRLKVADLHRHKRRR